MLTEELPQLRCQPVAQDAAFRAEVDVGWCILRHIEQTVSDAELGILQAKVQRSALLHLHPPDRFALSNDHRQSQCQPGFPDLGGTGQDVQTL